MTYELEIKSSARKELAALPDQVQRRIDAAILSLTERPRPRGAVKLAGRDNLWRVRAGDYRIIYRIEDDRLVVLVVRIAHRREAYR